MQNVNGRTFLVSLAHDVRDELLSLRLGPPLRIQHKPKTHATWTDGWLTTLGHLAGHGCSIQMWLDRFTSYRQRKLYYGIWASSADDLVAVEAHVRPAMGKYFRLKSQDAEDVGNNSRLKHRLARNHFGHPHFETYGAGCNYYGFYVFDALGLSRRQTPRLVKRVTGFVETVVQALPDAKSSDSSYAIYPHIENRAVVEGHVRRERSGHLATLRKQLDDYVCQVCGFNFAAVYGRLGREFAEAHHLKPLSSSERLRHSTVDDLATVCSNCHRMLHRMEGEPSDVQRLRGTVRRRGESSAE